MTQASETPGWRWFLVHTAAVAVLLIATLQNVAGSQVDPEGAITLGFTAPMYCLLAGFLTTLRSEHVLDAAVVGFVAALAGTALGLVAHGQVAHDSAPLAGLWLTLAVAVLALVPAVIGGGLARRLRRRWLAD